MKSIVILLAAAFFLATSSGIAAEPNYSGTAGYPPPAPGGYPAAPPRWRRSTIPNALV